MINYNEDGFFCKMELNLLSVMFKKCFVVRFNEKEPNLSKVMRVNISIKTSSINSIPHKHKDKVKNIRLLKTENANIVFWHTLAHHMVI